MMYHAILHILCLQFTGFSLRAQQECGQENPDVQRHRLVSQPWEGLNSISTLLYI